LNTLAQDSATDDVTVKFIEDYFVKPIAYLFLAILSDQGEKWKSDMEGKRSKLLKDLIKEKGWEESYFVFTDRDLKRVFEISKKAGEDPIIHFKLNKHMSVDDENFWLSRLFQFLIFRVYQLPQYSISSLFLYQ